MQAEIIAIGDEILIGQTLDTNSRFIASALNLRGITVKQKRVVADEERSIRQALDQLHPDTRLVFMTGGLGPTRDDITKQVLMDYFGGDLVCDPEVENQIRRLFKGFNREPAASNLGQAYIPSSCAVVPNDHGTAPGMRFYKEERYVFSTPGVPYETEAMLEKQILPWIERELGTGKLYHQTFLTQGYPESILAEHIENWEDHLDPKLSLAYLPSPGMVRLRLSGHAASKEASQRLVEKAGEELRKILGPLIFGTNEDSLAELIGEVLRESGQSLATAESCTGGAIAQAITSVPGSSQYFKGAVISYSNQVKMEQLGLRQADLERYGAVSEAVVRQMAEGARSLLKTDYALATSGVAGPDGGSAAKPVGYVWIAVAGPQACFARSYRFGRSRSRNIQRSTLMALDLLRLQLQGVLAETHHPIENENEGDGAPIRFGSRET